MMDTVRMLESWFDGRPMRERAVLAAAAIVVTVLLLEGLWWGPQRERAGAAQTDVTLLVEQKSTLAAELGQLEEREALDPDSAIRAQLDLLSGKITVLDQRLQAQTLQILAPEQMPAVLRDLIRTVEGLRITAVRSEAPQRLVNSAEDNLPVLYRHGLVIDLEGDYLGLLDCVRKLEDLPWRLYWLGMEVRADGMAPGEFRLHVYTVSLREEWIRV
jgi:MSHA biogenesis protein MshJ